MNISLIIPVKNDEISFKELFIALRHQSLKPKEIIVVDSSDNNRIKEIITENKFLNEINYISVKNKYPGEARNIGIKKSKYELIAFLDSKTIPNKNWLKNQFDIMIKNDCDLVFGSTKYKTFSKFQQCINSATFGNTNHTTTPGTLVKKYIAINNLFIEGVRTADDLEWRMRLLNKKIKFIDPKNDQLIYKSLPNNLSSFLKRYFIYSFHTAQVNVDNRLKFLYFFLISLFLFLIIPRWNQYLPNWNVNHPLYIQNHIKFYFLLFVIIILITVSIQNLTLFKKSKLNNFFKLVFFICSLIFVYNWNYVTINWIEKTSFYIPHITKIFIGIVFLTSFFVRGIYYPLKRKTNLQFILPFNWITIGFYGCLIDIVKAPAYLYGAILPKYFHKNNIFNLNYSNIIFYPKYGNKSPSFRTRFLSFKNFLNENNIFVDTKELFDETFYYERIFKKKLKFFTILYFYYIRIIDLFFRKKPFIAIVHVELLPYVPIFGELILKIRKIPYIIDIDDAVYNRFKYKNNFLYSLDKLKFKYMITNSAANFAGNYYHLSFLKKYNEKSYYFPTTIDFFKYDINKFKNKNDKFSIVWIGTPSTTIYLKSIINILNKIKNSANIDIKVIGADENLIKNLDCELFQWNEKNEVELISKCHLGIMPLFDTHWEIGKCAYKILQYMSLKIPVVASPVGVNKEIIIDRHNGMLAKNDEEWFLKIIEIVNNENLRANIAINGYETVKKHFNLENYKLPYYNIIKKITEKQS